MHQITVEASVLELCAIVTPDVLDLDTIIGHGMIGEAFEDIHYCRMLLTRHNDQRPFDETVWDAIITNGGVKNHQKRCKTFAMEDASNTVQTLVACAMQGIRFSSINYL